MGAVIVFAGWCDPCHRLLSEAASSHWIYVSKHWTVRKFLECEVAGWGGHWVSAMGLRLRGSPSITAVRHAFTGWRNRIGEMRSVPGWAKLVDAWDELEALYLEEVPKGTGRAPKLYARMRELTS